MRLALKFFRLHTTDRRLLAHAALHLAMVRLGLAILPFGTLCRGHAHMAKRVPRRLRGGTVSVRQIGWAVTVAGRYVPGSTCLVKALAVQSLLLLEGYQARLCIGVAKTPGAPLAAHAWTEYEGTVVTPDTAHLQYAPLLTLGQGGR